MNDFLALSINYWALGLTVGGYAAGVLLAAAVSAWRGKARRPVDPLGTLLGTAILAGLPGAFAFLAGLVVSAVLIEMGMPPIAYLFVGAAACAAFAAALKRPSYGMEGCTKMFAVAWSAYAVAWSAVSFAMLGGPEWIAYDARSLIWLRPLLVAAPYAAIVTRTANNDKRTVGKFAGALVLMSALFALIFLPVEAGFAAWLLPQSDWLRFPLAALTGALTMAALPILFALYGPPAARKRRLRELPRQAGMVTVLILPAGFLWAAARALTGALA